VVWSPAGDAWVVAAFIRDSSADYPVREACLADIGRLVVQLASSAPRA